MDWWWPNRGGPVEIQLQHAAENPPRRSIENHEESFLLLIYALALLAFASLGRLAPMPENFTPVAAVALFGGFLLPRGWQAVAIVWATPITDLFLGLYNPALMAAVYIAACAPIVLRTFLQPTVWRAGGCAIAGSALFFVSTNTAVWLLGTGYAPDASGLLASLSAGVPFCEMRSSAMFSFLVCCSLPGPLRDTPPALFVR